MIVGLLLIPGIPTAIGTCQAISTQKQKILEAKLCAKFNLVVHVKDKGAVDPDTLNELDGSYVVLLNGKLYVENSIPIPEGYKPLHRFAGYYFNFPAEEPIQSLVSTISDDPPMLNWIYVDKDTMEIKYANKSTSQEHIVGPWSWSGNEKELAIEEKSSFAIVEEETGAWGVYYDRAGDWSDLPLDGQILDVELERCVLPAPAAPTAE